MVMQLNFAKNGTLEAWATWHPINGKWVLLAMTMKAGKIIYYVDGEESPRP